MNRLGYYNEVSSEIANLLHYVPELGDMFCIIDKVGEGTFSKVFRAVLKRGPNHTQFALKYLIPTTRPSRISSELICLKELGGTNNIIGLHFAILYQGHTVIVMPYFPHHKFSEYSRHMAVDDAREYMKNLFIALLKVHSLGIIHRDVKPNNFLFNSTHKRYKLVDFGLAQKMTDEDMARYCLYREPYSDAAYRSNEPLTENFDSEQVTIPESPFKHPKDYVRAGVSKKRRRQRRSAAAGAPRPSAAAGAPTPSAAAGAPTPSAAAGAPTPSAAAGAPTPSAAAGAPMPSAAATAPMPSAAATAPRPSAAAGAPSSSAAAGAPSSSAAAEALGTSGTAGAPGTSWTAGPPGTSWTAGPPGTSWTAGAPGTSWAAEAPGPSWAAGAPGPSWAAGTSGAAGAPGTSGAAGRSNMGIHFPNEESFNNLVECRCFGSASVCKVCLAREYEEAPRGGTPGFRAPEVLLKYKYQTTAIDMWSAGVIFMSILSKKYPFFRAEDDLTSLAEIAFLVGTRELRDAANELGKLLTMRLPATTESISEMRRKLSPARFLQVLCLLIQQEQPCYVHTHEKEKEPRIPCATCHAICKTFPESAFDLLNRLLDPNPHTRISAVEALQHPFITNGKPPVVY